MTLALVHRIALAACLALLPPFLFVDGQALKRLEHVFESAPPAFQFTCTGSAQRIEATAGQSYTDITIWNGTNGAGANSTAVFLGDSTVTTTLGMPICSTSSCFATGAELPVRGAWCRTAGGSVVVTAEVLQ